MVFTEEQEKFLNSKEDSILLEAMAGCSKTTMLIEKAKRITEGKGLYLAFGNKNVKEIKDSLPSNWNCYTVHSHSNYIIKLNNLDLKIDKYKYSKNMFKDTHNLFVKSYREKGEYDYEDIRNQLYGYELKLLNKAIEKIDHSKISFEDMLYITKNKYLNKKKYSVVMIDEFQDLNLLQLNYIFSIETDKIIFSGDRFQGIYSFMGSKSNVVEYIANQCKMKFSNFAKYNIRNTFRFGQKICNFINNEKHLPVTINTNIKQEGTVILNKVSNPEKLLNKYIKNTNWKICVLFRYNKELKLFKELCPNLDKKIKLSTIHSSKGLEYNVVYIPNYYYLKHKSESIRNDLEFFESQNICYVALSRTKNILILD